MLTWNTIINRKGSLGTWRLMRDWRYLSTLRLWHHPFKFICQCMSSLIHMCGMGSQFKVRALIISLLDASRVVMLLSLCAASTLAVRGVYSGCARRPLWLCAASRMWLRHWSHDLRAEFVCVLVISSCVSHGNSAIVLRVETRMLWDGVFLYMRSDSFIVSMSRSCDFKSHVDVYIMTRSCSC